VRTEKGLGLPSAINSPCIIVISIIVPPGVDHCIIVAELADYRNPPIYGGVLRNLSALGAYSRHYVPPCSIPGPLSIKTGANSSFALGS
jgi:hypothetical protein